MGLKRKAEPVEIFLSHSSRNRVFATKLADVLRGNGLAVWYSRSDIIGAQQWHDEIGAALARCNWFIVILSPASVSAQAVWVKRELLYALNDPRYQKRIVPVLYRRCDTAKLSWTLPSMQVVDFTRDFDNGCRELLKIWGLSHAG